MKRIVYLVIVIGVLLGCGERREYREMLSRAEEMMNDHPDSALMILDSLGQHEKEFGRHFRMQFLLHRTNAASKTSERFSSDSLDPRHPISRLCRGLFCAVFRNFVANLRLYDQ